ncbi:MAG: hypothetical protein CSA61_02280 [Neptuniibacter caesariensis]|uniref:Peptidase M16 C-terminal domain-containing protein n=1 Tax=Neptuniibacter caesariensis TaxID=207954 RepID=A0A2G6JAC3_NEPCE|nr:MAG: hypothetical protein CSA61_02280 [Neptuniibacter caesariensis]
MTNEYRPFFSRKQITVLMWFSFLAIAVLSTMGPGAVEYHDIEHSENKNLYWMELDDQPYTLTLLLPTAVALNSQQRQLQQLKSDVIHSRLHVLMSADFSYQVSPKQDRIEVTLRWALNQKTPDIQALLQTLSQPVIASEWAEAATKIKARSYLNNQSAEQALLNQFYEQLQPMTATTLLDQLTHTYPELFLSPRVTISGENVEDLAATIQPLLPHQETGPTPAALTLSPQQLNNTQDKQVYSLLLGRILPARNAEQFTAERVAAQVLQNLLQNYKEQNILNFRMLWSAMAQSGYSALILTSAQNPVPLLPQLRQQLNDDLVESSQEQLVQQWNDRMRDINHQVSALNLVAFYQLPPETLEQYADSILDQDEDEILDITDKALQTTNQISILQSPSR